MLHQTTIEAPKLVVRQTYMTLAETLRQRCFLSVSLCNVGRHVRSISDLSPIRCMQLLFIQRCMHVVHECEKN